jgi:hypothetical protein
MITTARRFKRLYTDLVYQPMLKLLRFMRANGFKTYIVSVEDGSPISVSTNQSRRLSIKAGSRVILWS